MAVIKCKMCGGDLNVTEGESVCECEYCGTRQTVPQVDDGKKLTLFNRAGRLLRNCEFDKAAGVFESIIAEFPEEAEAYWGLVLCKYGIEYVDDPNTGKKIPTCHRSSFDCVEDDVNFEQACENTDAVARRIYRDEARHIEELRQAILEISGKEEPYDVFISYKDRDENNERTLDSVIAQDIYKELTDEGYRVFFSRISLEGKLGVEYEPYIFAALNSAKVMIVVGTDYENFDAVWVKNEWGRFLKLIASGQKKTLIPVYRDMDAYDMPKEFRKLSAQDMGKVGAMQDLVRGVSKLIYKPASNSLNNNYGLGIENEVAAKTIASVKRGDICLEEGDWQKAKDFYDQALSLNAECAEAYLGLACVESSCRSFEEFLKKQVKIPEHFIDKEIAFDDSVKNEIVLAYIVPGYMDDGLIRGKLTKKFPYRVQGEVIEQARKQFNDAVAKDRNVHLALRFAGNALKQRIDKQIEEANSIYLKAKKDCSVSDEDKRKNAEKEKNRTLSAIKEELALQQKVAKEKREEDYLRIIGSVVESSDTEALLSCLKKLNMMQDYKDSKDYAKKCQEKINDIEKARMEAIYLAASKIMSGASSIDDYEKAIAQFERIIDYPGCKDMIAQCKGAILKLENDEKELRESIYQKGCLNQNNATNIGECEAAIACFERVKGYKDSYIRIAQCRRKIQDFERKATINIRIEKSEKGVSELLNKEVEIRNTNDTDKPPLNAFNHDAQEMEKPSVLRKALQEEKDSLQVELRNLKGLFSGRRRKEIEARLREIEEELKLA